MTKSLALLPPTELIPAAPPMSAPARVRAGGRLTKAERLVVARGEYERAAVRETEQTTQEGLRAISRIHVAGVASFEEGTRHVFQVRNAPKVDEEHAEVVAEFIRRDVPIFANHLLGAMQTGSYNIAEAIATDHHQAVETPGRFRRFGG